ncbi:MAG TPA: ATP-binding protein [Terriglobales bacterium]|nr:ATP-binding protein [Terriglobales bacterium]
MPFLQPIDDEIDPITPAVHRTQLGLWIILAIQLLMSFQEYWAGTESSILLISKTLQVMAVLFGLLALQRPYFRQRTGGVSLTVFTVAVVMTAVAGVASNDAIRTPLLCIAITVASAAVMPWGARRQVIAGAIAVVAILINYYFLGQLGYATPAALLAVCASVFIAQHLEWQRDAEQRASLALRQREQFLRMITNGVPALIAYIDAAERCRYANRAFEDWFGLPRFLMNGQPIEELIVPEALAQLRPHIDAALDGREVNFEAIFTDRYGHPRLFAVTYVPDTSADATVRGFFSLASDITERKQAEESVRQHQAQLADALRLRTMGEMAAALAHELDQPLAAIHSAAQSCASMLANLELPAELRSNLERIVAESERAADMLGRLEELARRAEPKWEPVNVNQLVEDAARLVESEARHRNVNLRLDLAPTLPLVEADSLQVEQVILNLLLNAFQAVEAARNGNRMVVVKTQQRSDGEVEVAVRDSGVGLPPGIAKRIFEPYFTTRAGGLGLGLTISRSIIEAHGGRLWASSNPPSARGGATFRFNLPPSRPVADERAAG